MTHEEYRSLNFVFLVVIEPHLVKFPLILCFKVLNFKGPLMFCHIGGWMFSLHQDNAIAPTKYTYHINISGQSLFCKCLWFVDFIKILTLFPIWRFQGEWALINSLNPFHATVHLLYYYILRKQKTCFQEL